MNSPRDDELDALLREPIERLAPPPGSWETVSRKARRRKWAKAGASVAAGVVVLAAAVPAVIAVRHNAGDQTVQIANPPSRPVTTPPHTAATRPAPAGSSTPPSAATTTAVPADLVGFVPESVSFISQSVGFLWGSIGPSHQGVVAQTFDDGATWTRLPAPAVDTAGGRAGDGQIRFGRPDVGFIFGAKYFVTMDGGNTWNQYPSNGYIDDLETARGRVWALVRPTMLSSTVTLYSATVADPTLRPVGAVPTMHGVPGADSIAVNAHSVDVIVGNTAFWNSPDGVRWAAATNPCADQAGAGSVESTQLTTLDLGSVIAACGYDQNAGTEQKRVFATTDSGQHWSSAMSDPGASGYLQTFAAGTPSDLILGTSQGGAQITHDGGGTWHPVSANGVALGFVGFIDPGRIVATGSDGSAGAFATSDTAGRTWQVYSFTR